MTPDSYGLVAFWFTFILLMFIIHGMMRNGEFPTWTLHILGAMFCAGQFGELAQYVAKYFALRFL